MVEKRVSKVVAKYINAWKSILRNQTVWKTDAKPNMMMKNDDDNDGESNDNDIEIWVKGKVKI